jgi:hypothetical protein
VQRAKTTLDVLLMPLLFIQIHPMELLLSIIQPNVFYRSLLIIGQKIFSAENTTKSEITIQILLEEPTWFASVPIISHKELIN